MIPPISPIRYAILAFATTCGLAGAAVTFPAHYKGTAAGYAMFDLDSTLFLGEGIIRGTAEVTAVLSPGQMAIDEIRAELESATWSASGSFVNASFQTINVTLTIVTNPVSFVIASGQSFPLKQTANGTLEWNTLERPVTSSGFLFSGSWTLQGSTETVTGTFSHTIGHRGMITDGILEVPNFPDEILLAGGAHAFFPGGINLPIVNGTVNGVNIRVTTFGVRSGSGAGFGNVYGSDRTVLTAVPEPSAMILLSIASAGLLVRRRK